MLIKKTVFAFLICILSFSLASCGIGDWGYVLPNGYEISRINSGSICLCSEDYWYDRTSYVSTFTTTFVLNGYVRKFCYNDRYVGAQFYDYQFMYDNSEAEHFEETCHDIETCNPEHIKIKLDDVKVIGKEFDKYTPDFYLVDTENHTRMGPFTAEEYDAKLSELGITDMCEWLVTTPAPEGAVFY